MSEDLLRQRRNVIIASCLLWFFHFGNVTVNSVSYSDIDFNIGDKNSVYLALWVFYFYAMLRFFVYFSEDGWSALKFSFIKILDESCINRISCEISAKCNGEIINNMGITIGESSVSKKGFEFVYMKENKEEEVVLVPHRKMLPSLLKGVLVFVFLRTALTDYAFPFLVSAYVLWNTGFSEWPGSLINIM